VSCLSATTWSHWIALLRFGVGGRRHSQRSHSLLHIPLCPQRSLTRMGTALGRIAKGLGSSLVPSGCYAGKAHERGAYATLGKAP
jgi:hypothetical protein